MLILIILLIIVLIIYLKYKEYNENILYSKIEEIELEEIVRHCNPKIIEFFDKCNKYDKKIIKMYIADIMKTNGNIIKKNNIKTNILLDRFKSSSYAICCKYILDLLNNNIKVINIPLSSVFGYIIQTII